MRCVSTRGGESTSLSAAIAKGLAPDGGLYLPESCPRQRFTKAFPTLTEAAIAVLEPFFEGELLAPHLDDICREAFSFDAPTRWLDDTTGLLELFHGPTAAFKDYGARFLAGCLARLTNDSKPTTVLVATSGDTGAAVASAFHRRPGFRVVILYPSGRVSARQAHQLGSFQDNVTALQVRGSFDDCQSMVKTAFGDTELASTLRLVSANSISLGRLLPQAAYFAHAALAAYARTGEPVPMVVPSGNLGNGFACLLARARGFPIGDVTFAANANRVVPDALATGVYEPRPSVATLANAMDVGAPSNLERLISWFSLQPASVSADSVDDRSIEASIVRTFHRFGVAVCPHTACGLEVLHREREKRRSTGTAIVAATAHPAKFESIVEPLINEKVPVPTGLAELLRRPSKADFLDATFAALKAMLMAS